jgi:hypothetical protein
LWRGMSAEEHSARYERFGAAETPSRWSRSIPAAMPAYAGESTNEWLGRSPATIDFNPLPFTHHECDVADGTIHVIFSFLVLNI